MFSRILQITYNKGGCNVNKRFARLLTGTTNNEAANNSPLDGIRILDLSRILAGPFCTMLLGDLGAEIIKVENPSGGDATRTLPPFIKEESAYFMSANRNKKSIAIDLKLPKGRELIRELAKKSDVLVENFIPGTMSKFGLDYKNLKEIAPQLIYCSISGFGQTGPYSSRTGVDIIAASIGGMMHITGPKGGEPCSVGVPLTDISTGIYAHGAIMAALLQRIKTGQGQNIDCDLLSTQVSLLSYVGVNYLNLGMEANRLGSLSDTLVPYQAFKTKDGYFSISCVGDNKFTILCERLNIPEFGKDPLFETNELRLKNIEAMSLKLGNIFITNTTDHWQKFFEGSGLSYGPVNNIKEVFNDPQVIHKNMVCEMDHSKCGRIKVIGPAVTFSNGSNKVRSPPPYLGEHTDTVLSEILSYSNADIQDLRNSKVIE